MALRAGLAPSARFPDIANILIHSRQQKSLASSRRRAMQEPQANIVSPVRIPLISTLGIRMTPKPSQISRIVAINSIKTQFFDVDGDRQGL